MATWPAATVWLVAPEAVTVKSNGTVPVPLRATATGLAADVETMDKVPVAAPEMVGVKTTPVEQLAPADRLLAQVFWVRLKGGATASVSDVAAKLPVLAIVTVCAALAWPTSTAGKVNCAGVAPSTVVVEPLPLSGTETGVTPRDEEETMRVAALKVALAGVKIACTVQLLPLASTAPQVVVPVA